MHTKPEEAAIHVVLADNQKVARLGMRAVLKQANGIAVMAETASGEEALQLARTHAPDVLVTEMDLPDLSGIQLAIRLAEAGSSVQLLAFTAYEDERYIRHLMENGIAGYLRKSDPVQYLVEAVRALAGGEERWLSPRISQRVMALRQRKDAAVLLKERGVTPREEEVLRLMAKGRLNQEIADSLNISKTTTRTHVSHLYARLDVRSRPELIAWAWEHGLVKPQGA